MKKYLKKSYVFRYIIVLITMFMVGLGMSIMRISCLGTEPFSCLGYSISEHFGLPLGVVLASINGILLILSFFKMKEALGFGTIVNLFLLGTAGDFWGKMIQDLVGYEVSFIGMEKLVLRLFLLCIGMCIMVFSTSFYISCEMGMGAYDALGYIVERVSGKIPFKWARVGIDSVCVIIAWIIAKSDGTQWEIIGIGTVIMAFCIGPLLTFFIEKIARPVVNQVKNM